MKRIEARELIDAELRRRHAAGLHVPKLHNVRPRDMERELSPQQERATRLFLAGMSYAEIARELGISRNRASQLLRGAHAGGQW